MGFILVETCDGDTVILASRLISQVYPRGCFDEQGNAIPHNQCLVFRGEDTLLIVNHTIDVMRDKLSAR